MDILIRIFIMIICGLIIPHISKTIYEPLNSFEELNIVVKILWSLAYIFIINWFVIGPSLVFVECFKYVFMQ